MEKDSDCFMFMVPLEEFKECSKASFKDSFPLLYKAAEELDAAVGEGLLSDNDLAILEKGLSSTMTEEEIKRCKKGLETTLLMKREFNELVQSKRAFAKLSSSGFCVTLSGPAEAASVLCSESDGKRGDSAQRKSKTATKVPEIRDRMRKALEERHTEVVTSTKGCTVNIQQGKIQIIDEMNPPPAEKPKKNEESPDKAPKDKDLDVDELVQIIEGINIKPSSNNDPNPKKMAKKARQKEKKEQERQRMAEEKAKEEEQRKAEELRLLEEEKRKEEQERQRLADEEQRRKDEVIRKQRELAEQKKEEQRKKRQEIERKKAEEKKQKKEAKKQRREQRKKEMESFDGDDGSGNKSASINESLSKTDYAHEKEGNRTPSTDVSEKEYGRLKHEKEQRKREQEEARRIEQLQAQERSQANKKNKKKKKKSKHNDSQGQTADEPTNLPKDDSPKISNVPIGQPLIEILNSSKMNEGGMNPEESNKLVTIKKHMDSSVTISMKGKEGESDLVYTLMNGQVYPTSVDGKVRTEASVPLQHTSFVKQENARPSNLLSMANAPTTNHHPGFGNCNTGAVNVNTMRNSMYQANSNFLKESSAMGEIDLSQLKLPPGITITKVPQQISGPRCDDMNGAHNVDFHSRNIGHPNVTDYHRSAPVGVVDNRHNSNIMVVDSRCSSLESPVIGVRPADMAFGANGTRPSSEASVASDRPSSGLDSLCNNNGSSPFVNRTGYPSSEMISKRVPISLSSPFTAASRNETPSPAWPNDVHSHMCGMPGMIPQNNQAAAERHGFWSSTPASPVAFPQSNSVSESYLRAQDQQFIRPRPQQRGVYPQIGKRTSPSSGISTDNTLFTRKASSTDFKPIGGGVASNVSPHYNHGHITVNGSTTPSNLGPIGYKSVIEPHHTKPVDQWTPWNHNADRMSPDTHPVVHTPQFVPTDVPFSLANVLCDDINGPWESQPIEKPASRTVNPFGPIGSNITRRSSNATSNGLRGKVSEPSGSEDASLWTYNRTF